MLLGTPLPLLSTHGYSTAAVIENLCSKVETQPGMMAPASNHSPQKAGVGESQQVQGQPLS